MSLPPLTTHLARTRQICLYCLSEPLDNAYPHPHGLLCRSDGYALLGSGNWCGISDLLSIARRDLPGGDREIQGWSVPCMEHWTQGTGSLKHTLAARLGRDICQFPSSCGVPSTPAPTHLGTARQELLPWREVLGADNLPRQNSIAQEVVIGV